MQASPILSSLWLIILTLILQACAHHGVVDRAGSGKTTSYADRQTWIKAAVVYEQRGDLAKALMQYRIARAVAPGDTRIEGEIRRLQSAIDLAAAEYTRAGEASLKQGDVKRARQDLLQALSLDPRHTAALSTLRKIEESDARRAMLSKARLSYADHARKQRTKRTSKDDDESYTYSRQALLQPESRPKQTAVYIQELEIHLKKYPDDQEIRQLLIGKLLQQADLFFEREDYARTWNHLQKAESVAAGNKQTLKSIKASRQGYAKQLYTLGLRAYRDDLSQAVRYWQTALKFNPDDARTRLRLQNAKVD